MGIFGHLDFIISRLCLKGLHFVILITPLSKDWHVQSTTVHF